MIELVHDGSIPNSIDKLVNIELKTDGSKPEVKSMTDCPREVAEKATKTKIGEVNDVRS